jgi:TetR/AcrR family transcriptional regulator, transcriptional repressor for nem operon
LPVRQRLAGNFQAWVDAIHECLQQAGERLAKDLDRREVAQFVLTTMEGGVMQARTFRDVAYFDSAVNQLRQYFSYLNRGRAARTNTRTRARPVRRKSKS